MQKNRFFDLCPKFWHGFYDVPIRAIPQATPYCLTYKYIFPIKSHQSSALYIFTYIYVLSFVVVATCLNSFHLLRWAAPNRSRQRKDRFATFRYILHMRARADPYACTRVKKIALYFFVVFRYNINI